jgi:hypothetical protein
MAMPTYTVRKQNSESGIEWDIQCSYKELQEICDEYGLEKVIKPVGFITQSGGTLSRTSTDFRNNLERIKKNHPGSTIKT